MTEDDLERGRRRRARRALLANPGQWLEDDGPRIGDHYHPVDPAELEDGARW